MDNHGMSKDVTKKDSVTDAELIKRFHTNFTLVASLQGRVAYLIMSAHAIHPYILNRYVTPSATKLLYFNMLYGIGIMIYSRPNMKRFRIISRISFGTLGTIMFNYSSITAFKWIKDTFATCMPTLAVFMSVLTGRIFMLHLLAFLYHVDTNEDPTVPRNSAFESMYSTQLRQTQIPHNLR